MMFSANLPSANLPSANLSGTNLSGTDLSFTLDRSVRQGELPRSPRETLPTMYDLPSEFPEEPGLPDEYHDIQPQLLSRTLYLTDYPRKNYFTASDLNLYYDIKHPLWHKRSDWFLVVGVSRLYDGESLRRSYVTWQEKATPDLVVEFLSPGTAREDLGRFYEPESLSIDNESPVAKPSDLETTSAGAPGKLEVYEQFLKVPHYIVYSHHTQQLRYFKLVEDRYEEQSLKQGNCRLWLDDLKIGLGIWAGEFD